MKLRTMSLCTHWCMAALLCVVAQVAAAQPCFSGAGFGGVAEVLVSSVFKLVMPFAISTLL